ncbi:helix-turn-helix domain-containing protein [Robertmurraya kyonggiensis]|uniref:Helix-turn-helix domain-containing protein n=1 Tax=Robertmurraya kyonggiensis TaxID=1037680 RepID=A0A4U1CWZ6_9BACI|nr:helix-turn-helix domain-containing protein [Robertmurraya kyonggiensis]TKC14365.1 helix-turn-helix domain-containing protein [Robertmurraya kyonggiensis]
MPENQDQEKMLSIKETAEFLGMGESTLSKKLHSFSAKGIVNDNKRVWIPLSSIPELKKSLNYNDEFDKGTYYSTAEVAIKFNENGLKVKRTDVSNWIKKRKVKTIMHMGYRYINENDLDQFIENIISERTIPEGFCTLEEAANILEMHPQTIRDWALNGDIESMRVIVNDYWQTLVKRDSLQAIKKKKRISSLKNFAHVDIASLSKKNETKNNNKNHNPNNIESLEGYLDVKFASTILGIKANSLAVFLRNGKFPSAIKVKNRWYIPIEDIQSYEKKIKNRNKTPSKDTKEIPPLDGHFTTSEVSNRINLSISRVIGLINQGLFPNAIKANNKWFIPKEDILTFLLNKKVDPGIYYSLDGYLTIADVVNRYSLSHSQILILIKKNLLPNAMKINQEWFIPIKDILFYQEEITRQTKQDIMKNLSLDGHLSVSEIVNRFNLGRNIIYYDIHNGVFPNAKKTGGEWYIPEEELNYYFDRKNNQAHDSNFIPPQGYLTTKEVAKKLGISVSNVFALKNTGKFDGIKKINKYWLIPEPSVEDYKNQKEKNQISITKPDMINELKQYINNVQDKKHLKETIRLYSDFSTTRLNATNGRINNIRRVFNHLKNLFSEIISNLDTEIYKLPNKDIEAVMKNRSYSSPIRELFLKFLKDTFLIKEKKLDIEYVLSRKAVKTDKDIDSERYSPDVYYLFELHSKDIEKHLVPAINSRHYANMWVLTAMLLTNAWRPSDIIFEMPHIDIEIINISELDWFIKNRLSLEQCQLVVNQLYLKLNNAEVSKTNADLHFLVAPDMVKCLAYACVISELHCRKLHDDELSFEKESLLLGSFITGITENAATSGSNTHKKFFKDEPKLTPFSSKKLHNSTMTYLFLDISEDEDESELALEVIKWARSHEDINVTAGYIKLTNRDGTLERVSINLFKRGHFGWLYNFMVQLALSDTGSPQSLEERTQTIEELKKEYTPIQLEAWAKTLLDYKNRKESIVTTLYKMSTEQLKKILIKVYKGQMPSRDGCGQCLSFPNCHFPNRKPCIGCINFIPQLQQVLIEAKEEFYRLIDSIKNCYTDTILKRDSVFLFNVLLLFNEAAETFGNDIVDGFLSSKDRKNAIYSVADKLQLPAVNN